MPLLGFLTAKNVIYCICWSQRFWYRFHSIALVLIMDATMRVQSRSWNWSRKQSEFFGWSRIPNNTGSRSWIFLSDSRCSIGSFFTSLLKLGIPVKMVQFLLKLLLKQISCCAPRFPLILTAKFHLMLKGRSRKFGKAGVGSRKFCKGQSWSRSRIFYLRLRNPGQNIHDHFNIYPLFVENMQNFTCWSKLCNYLIFPQNLHISKAVLIEHK